MSSNIKIHLHFGGSEASRSHHAIETKTLEALIAELFATGVFGDAKIDEISVFEEDSDDEVARDLCFAPAHHGKRFQFHRCKKITVTFISVDDKKTESFRPGATVKRLLTWAKHHFPVEQNKPYELRLTGDGEALPLAEHLGAYAKTSNCAVTLYFTPSCKILG
jgi:hypothetical protein